MDVALSFIESEQNLLSHDLLFAQGTVFYLLAIEKSYRP